MCRYASAYRRTERNRKAGVCLNENQKGEHGLPTHGSYCLRCYLVRLYGPLEARALEMWKEFVPARSILG